MTEWTTLRKGSKSSLYPIAALGGTERIDLPIAADGKPVLPGDVLLVEGDESGPHRVDRLELREHGYWRVFLSQENYLFGREINERKAVHSQLNPPLP